MGSEIRGPESIQKFALIRVFSGQLISACKPCGGLSLDFFMRDAFATVELIHPFLDCRKKFDLLGDLLQRNLIWQLTNDIQHNFFLAYVDELPGANKQINLQDRW